MRRSLSAALCLAVAAILFSQTAALASGPSDPHSGEVNALLLVCHDYGGNYNLIRDVMELYGWNVTTTGVTPTVTPCFWGGALTVDVLVSNITDLSQYDVLLVMQSTAWSGNSHYQLLNSPPALALVQQAANAGLLVTAFCGGTRVLAAADLIDGVTVTGHPLYQQEYVNAGAIPVGMGTAVPPVLDGNILTCRRTQYYAYQVCDVIAEYLHDAQAGTGAQ